MHFEKQNGAEAVGDIAGEIAGDAALEGHTGCWVGCPPEGDPHEGRDTLRECSLCVTCAGQGQP